MNTVGLALVGLVFRSTVVAVLGVMCVALLRRRGPAAGSLAAFTSLLVLAGVAGLAVSPWPRWWTVGLPKVDPRPSEIKTEARSAESVPESAPRGLSKKAGAGPTRTSPKLYAWTDFLSLDFSGDTTSPSAAEAKLSWRWPSWLALAYFLGLAASLGWLLLGLQAIRSLRRGSRRVDDVAVLDEVELLRAEMGCTPRITVLESDHVTAPATIGWRRPVILVPAGWSAWDEQERRAVLAHELAHVVRGDYLLGILGQTSLALNFYHPLACWLAGQLRLQQELAADAWGAGVVGGIRPYLTTLAQIALRHDAQRAVHGPARAFLPARGTFLRRIEMLRDAKQVRHAPLSKWSRILVVVALTATGLVVAGLRGPAGLSSSPVQAQTTSPRTPGQSLDLSYLPGQASILLGIRAADLNARPELKPLIAFLMERVPFKGTIGDLDHLLVFWLPTKEEPGAPAQGREPLIGVVSGLIAKANRPQDWKKVAAGFLNDWEEVSFEGHTYARSKSNRAGFAYFTPDSKTLILAREQDLQSIMKAGPNPKSAHAWDRVWKSVEPGQVALAVDSTWIRSRVHMLTQAQGPQAASLAMFAPLWEKSKAFALGLKVDEGVRVNGEVDCESDKDINNVVRTVDAILTLGRNIADGLRQQGGSQIQARILEALLEPLLKNAKIRFEMSKKENLVQLESVADIELKPFAEEMVPALKAARAAASKAQSINNLRQIALAMHQFHSAKEHFPPAVLLGPDGKTPHSWRVALLPYLGRDDLYQQYRFDEPWDSAHNRKLLDQAPTFFRSPVEPNSSANASYFVLTGPETLFSDQKGSTVSSVRDGAHITLMVVEAKRDIPWTKPEDIPWARNGPLPKLGGYSPGGFLAAFADGSCLFLSENQGPEILKAIITPAGGEIVERDALLARPAPGAAPGDPQ